MDNKILYSLKNVNLKYNRSEVAHDLSMEINEGEFLVFSGANRSGKSTVIKALIGELQPSGGSIYIDNKPINYKGNSSSSFWTKFKEAFQSKKKKQEKYDQRSLSQRIAYLSQISYLPSTALVVDYLKTSRTAHTSSFNLSFEPEEHDKYVNFALDKMNITNIKDKKLSELNNVEKEKVLIAAAIAKNTDIIVLDDPFKNIDPLSQVELYSLLMKFNKETNKTVIVTSDTLNQGMLCASSVCLLKDGKKVVDAYATESLTEHNIKETFGDAAMMDSLDGKIKFVDFKILPSLDALKQKIATISQDHNINLNVYNISQSQSAEPDITLRTNPTNPKAVLNINELSAEDKKNVLDNITNIFNGNDKYKLEEDLTPGTSADQGVGDFATYVVDEEHPVDPLERQANEARLEPGVNVPVEDDLTASTANNVFKSTFATYLTETNDIVDPQILMQAPRIDQNPKNLMLVNDDKDLQAHNEDLDIPEGYFLKYIVDFDIEPKFAATRALNDWEHDYESATSRNADFLDIPDRNLAHSELKVAPKVQEKPLITDQYKNEPESNSDLRTFHRSFDFRNDLNHEPDEHHVQNDVAELRVEDETILQPKKQMLHYPVPAVFKEIDFSDDDEHLLSGEFIINFDDPWNCVEDKELVIFNYDTKSERDKKERELRERQKSRKKVTSGRVISRRY